MAVQFDRHIIAPYNNGIDRSVRPWLIPEDAFEDLRNVYPYRGRIVKRFGSSLMTSGEIDPLIAPLYSKLSIALVDGMGNPVITNGSGDASGTVPGTKFDIGQQFLIGTDIFTVYQTGVAQDMLSTNGAASGTYSTTNGAFTIDASVPNTQVYFFTNQPVMGLPNYEIGQINNQPSFGFDTQYSYEFGGGRWVRIPTGVWHGTDSDFFWTTNWQSQVASKTAMFTSNFFVTNPEGIWTANDDPIWFYNGTQWQIYSGNSAVPTWCTVTQTPFVEMGVTFTPYIVNGRIILPFKNRLLILNTIENDGNQTQASSLNFNYKNRCRYSANQSPFLLNSWLETNQTFSGTKFAGAGYIDAATEEAIVGAEFLKDRLIVKFEESTWEIVYTSNQIQPFLWQKINTELGTGSTFSMVPFDRDVVTVGQVGIDACTGGNVVRIDEQIPNQVFEISDENNGVKRVYGIRDYYTELIYWTFSSDYENKFARYPNKVLVFNYKNRSWALNDDCITCFGYFEQQDTSTWANTRETWENLDSSWGDGPLSSRFRQVIGGNQQGYVFIIDAEQTNSNAPVMTITNMAYDVNSLELTLTVINHTLVAEEYYDYVKIENAQGVTFDGPGIFKVTLVPSSDENTVVLGQVVGFTGEYTGGGTLRRVSNPQILTKQYNPYTDQGMNVFVGKIDFLVDKTTNGEITVDYFADSSRQNTIEQARLSGSLLGTSILTTKPYDLYFNRERLQDRLWHTLYFQTQGNCIQLFMYLAANQIMNPLIANANFELHSLILYTRASATRIT